MDENKQSSMLQTRLPRRRLLSLVTSAGFGSALLACTSDGGEDGVTGPPAGASATAAPDATSGRDGSAERPEDWTETSHSNDAEPDYAIVFPEDLVNQMTFTISPENWQAMLDDLTELAGERGARPGSSAARPGGSQQGGETRDLVSENPIWVPATVGFNGLQWRHVGLRFKGNSSLRNAWSRGTDKMPFKLDFDEFEDDHPEIDNQRFYGFKQLSLSNNWRDDSFMRESVTYDVLEEAGLVAAETGFYEIVLDYGEGPKSLGLYTVIEVVDDTVIPRYFDDDSGNIYEGEGPGASFAEGTDIEIPGSFQVESDEEQADWSDIRALQAVLHSKLRLEDPDAWRENLEGVFNVEPFLKWLAASTLLQHWDAYGVMSHNYYLYNDPDTGQINWISWDHNLVLGAGSSADRPDGSSPGAQQQRGGFGPAGRTNTAFDKSGVGEEWPLISYLLAQPEYAERYNAAIRELIEGAFEPSRVIARIEANERILAPYANQENTSYEASVDALIEIVEQRVRAAEEYLASL